MRAHMKLLRLIRSALIPSVLVQSLFALMLTAGHASAADINVAVAANFTEPAKEIAAAFKQKTGHTAV